MRWILATLFVLMGAVVSANPLEIRSGEHADFSRIVILSDDFPGWTFGKSDTGYELRISDSDVRFDLQLAFELIPRTRIRNIEDSSGGRLLFFVDCQCHADVFEIPQGLVVDIRDGNPPVQTAFEEVLPDLDNATGERVVAFQTAETQRPSNVSPDQLAERFLAPRSNILWNDRLAVAPKPITSDRSADKIEMSETTDDVHVETLRNELVLQLGRAATQGLVTADVTETERRIANTKPDAGETSSGSAVEDDTPLGLSIPEILENSENIRIETAVDRGQRLVNEALPLTDNGNTCFASSWFDISTWGTPPTQGEGLSLSRSDIVGEFDDADPRSIEALARRYLYMTFGTEARALLTAFDTKLRDRDVLIVIAQIMDDGTANAPFMRDQLACDTNAAMWAAMSVPKLSEADNINIPAVISSFSNLPLHLRRHLGPNLAQRFLDLSDFETADTIREIIDRAPGDPGDGFDLLSANLAVESGKPELGTQQLTEIAKDEGILAPEAVIRLIDVSIAANQSLPDNIEVTAAAMAYEAQGTPLGQELTRVHIRALAHKKSYTDAIGETKRAHEAGKIPDETAFELIQETFDLATTDERDEDFLQIALVHVSELEVSSATRPTRRKIATRLIDLGLPKPARDVLAIDPEVPTPEDRLIYARSFIKDNAPDLAIGYLAGLTDSEALSLRAKAFEAAGDYKAAAKIYAELKNSEGEARAVWRDENWALAQDIGTPIEREAATLATQDIAGVLDPSSGPLAQDRALLDQSQETRELIASLLADTKKP